MGGQWSNDLRQATNDYVSPPRPPPAFSTPTSLLADLPALGAPIFHCVLRCMASHAELNPDEVFPPSPVSKGACDQLPIDEGRQQMSTPPPSPSINNCHGLP